MKCFSELSQQDRKQYMDTVNRTVLKMIHHKKYPLCPEKINRIRRNKEKYQLTKLTTSPNKLLSSPQPSPYGSVPASLVQKSMGDYFQTERMNAVPSICRASDDFEEVNSQLNDYIWERRREIA